MNKIIVRNVRLGIFVVTGILLLVVGLYFIGNNKNMFGRSFRLYTTFGDVNGLTVGNNVRYAGIDVGTVQNIEILNDTTIHVEMIIDESLKKFIRKNSIASVGTDGLMGNKLINIDPGTSGEKLVTENDEIPSIQTVNTEAMLRTLELTNSNIALVSSNLKEITENVNNSRGTLYTVLMDTMLAGSLKHTLDNIENASNTLNQLSEEVTSIVSGVKSGKGIAGVLLTDSAMDLEMRTIIQKIRSGSEQFSSVTNEANELIHRVNNGSGTLSVLLNDTGAAANIKKSLSNIESSSRKLEEDLEALKHSFLLRGYFKKQEKAKRKK